MKKYLIIGLLITVLLSACQPAEQAQTVRIAYQYGLAYAPLTIAKEKGFIDEALGDTKVEWIQLANASAIREAMVANQLDVGFMGIPPFLIGCDKQTPWKLFTGLSESPLALMSNQSRLQELSDFTSNDKIATPQPGSIQHILLMMAAQQQLGDAQRFDDQLVSLKHPDAMAMLLSGEQIVAHFASPPYLFSEQAANLNTVVTGKQAFGSEFTFIVGAYYENDHIDDPTLAAIQRGLVLGQSFIAENPAETVTILAEQYGIDQDLLADYLYQQGIVFSSEIKGLAHFIEFMHQAGYLTNELQEEAITWSEID